MAATTIPTMPMIATAQITISIVTAPLSGTWSSPGFGLCARRASRVASALSVRVAARMCRVAARWCMGVSCLGVSVSSCLAVWSRVLPGLFMRGGWCGSWKFVCGAMLLGSGVAHDPQQRGGDEDGEEDDAEQAHRDGHAF